MNGSIHEYPSMRGERPSKERKYNILKEALGKTLRAGEGAGAESLHRLFLVHA